MKRLIPLAIFYPIEQVWQQNEHVGVSFQSLTVTRILNIRSWYNCHNPPDV